MFGNVQLVDGAVGAGQPEGLVPLHRPCFSPRLGCPFFFLSRED